MKLICPNCDAQYQVDDSMIPDAGRDVQCSNCGSTWFQQSRRALDEAVAQQEQAERERAAAAAQAEADAQAKAKEEAQRVTADAGEGADEDEPEGLAAAMAEPARRAVDDAVLEVLREEAQREKAARAAAAAPRQSTVVDTRQAPSGGDAAEPAAAPPAPKPRETTVIAPPPRPSHRSEPDAEAEDKDAAPAEDAPEAPAERPARKNQLPDIEAINSTLRASADPARSADPGQGNAELARRAKHKSGVRLGFGIVLFVAAIALVSYIHGPRIGSAVPFLKAPLEGYVEAVNRGRHWLDRQVSGLTPEETTPEG